MIRDEQKRRARELPDYSDETEDTKRTDVHVHVHQPTPSQPDIEIDASVEVGPIKVTGLPRWAVALVAVLAAAGTAVVAHFAGR